MTENRAARTPNDSRVLMTEIVLPEDANTRGTIFGGRVLALIDKAGAIVAMRHCRTLVVTAAIDRVDFLAGARTGSILILEGVMNAAFGTSVEVSVTVQSEDPLTGHRHLTCRAFVTLVAVDDSGRPVPVPRLEPITAEDRLRAAQALERRKHRVAHS
jgi:acyl-CoA hydrolase